MLSLCSSVHLFNELQSLMFSRSGQPFSVSAILCLRHSLSPPSSVSAILCLRHPLSPPFSVSAILCLRHIFDRYGCEVPDKQEIETSQIMTKTYEPKINTNGWTLQNCCWHEIFSRYVPKFTSMKIIISKKCANFELWNSYNMVIGYDMVITTCLWHGYNFPD